MELFRPSLPDRLWAILLYVIAGTALHGERTAPMVLGVPGLMMLVFVRFAPEGKSRFLTGHALASGFLLCLGMFVGSWRMVSVATWAAALLNCGIVLCLLGAVLGGILSLGGLTPFGQTPRAPRP